MTSQNDRALILALIENALRDGPGTSHATAASPERAAPDRPVTGSAMPEGTASGTRVPEDRAALARRFRSELEEVGGEARFVARDEDLPAAIARLASERGFGPASVNYATADYALLRAEALLADTGSAVVIERSADRRLAPYLPRTCVIVGDASALYPTLSSEALAAVHDAARRGERGEAIIITGPSRTADIEKVLVLGAHGPRHVIVFVVGVDPETLA